MSFLAPFFLVAGGMLAAPIILHLIRKQPKASREFSSLLFLRPSPPRLTRRSRIDNWLLLAIRLLAVAMIVAAFSRPFMRSDSQTTLDTPLQFRVLLVDTSASMQRDDLWNQTLDQVDAAVEKLSESDAFAIITFDSRPRVLRSFDAEDGLVPSDARTLLAGHAPSYFGTELGTALMAAADLLTSVGEVGDNANMSIALISDLQEGGNAQTLQSFTWPDDIVVEMFPVKPASPSNASAVVLNSTGNEEETDEEDDKSIRVAVTNSTDSEIGNYQIRWVAPDSRLKLDATTVNLQPGQTRVVRVESPPTGVVALELVGDDHSFDNQFYIESPELEDRSVPFIGPKREDPRADLFYYLERLPIQSKYARLNFQRWNPDDETQLTEAERKSLTDAPVIFLHSEVAAPARDVIATNLKAGGRVVIILDSTTVDSVTIQGTLTELTGDQGISISRGQVKDYTTLTQIDFKAPLFQPFADPRYSDFSKIQFWSVCDVTVGDDSQWQTLARFEGGSPAILRHPVDKGDVYLIAAGWQPSESRLALSTKFVPLISGLVQVSPEHSETSNLWLGERPTLQPTSNSSIVTPEQQSLPVRELADLDVIDRPGRYEWVDGDVARSFVANITPDESRTAPLEPAILEQLGVTLTSERKLSHISEAERQLRDMELENRQQWWQVLLAIALGLLFLETLLSSRQRSHRQQDQNSAAPTSPSVA